MKKKISGLYSIIDPLACRSLSPFELASDFLSGGVHLIQLRQKEGTNDEIELNAREILSLKSQYDFTFIINDDVLLAEKIGADGVHLGQMDMGVGEAREILGSEKIIGKSTHSVWEAEQAVREGADYIACGAIFSSPTKSDPNHPIIGIVGLNEILKVATVPVVAIGGINRMNVLDVLRTQVPSIALVSALTGAEDIITETRYFTSLFQVH